MDNSQGLKQGLALLVIILTSIVSSDFLHLFVVLSAGQMNEVCNGLKSFILSSHEIDPHNSSVVI